MVSPLGATADATFEACVAGRSGVREIRQFDVTGLPCTIGGEVDDAGLDPLPPGDDPAAPGPRPYRLLVTAARQAAAAADLASLADRARVSVVIGGHAGSPRQADVEEVVRVTDASGRVHATRLPDAPAYDPRQFDRRRCDFAPARLARDLDARGAAIPVVAACSASAQAIGEGLRLLREGRADAVVAGGAEAHLDYTGFVGFVLLGALVKRWTSPEKASRPFDRRRSGFVMSEAAAVLVLETLAHARARRRPVLGEVLGYGDSADGYRITDVHPEGEGALRAMRRALADAGLSPDDVEYVNAHGTSTPTNDPAETLALKRLFGDRAKRVPASSNKSMLGHTIGAAGAVEAVLTFLGMRHGVLLPTINQEVPDPRCDLDYVPNEARAMPHRVAISNSFGFGGQNACLALGAAE
jgi:3-oxoacyl-[acyl-carrier-protein] synthase II